MKALFAGLGSIGQRHLRNLTRLAPEVRLIAHRTRRSAPVLDDSMRVDESADLVRDHELVEYDELDRALGERPDVAFITNPSALHVDTALRCVAAGCHVFVEKPLASSWQRVEELIDRVEARGLVGAVGYQLRMHPGVRLVEEWLRAGRVGNVVSATLRNGEALPDWHPYEDYREGYAAREELGGGALLTQIHELDLALWLFGMPTRVFAVGGRLSRLEVDVEDCATVLLECRPAGRPLPVTVQLDYVQAPPVRSCTIVGDAGRIELDLIAGAAVLRTRDAVVDERFADFARNDMFVAELGQFLDAVRGAGKPAVDLREGARSLRLALAARRSLGEGRAVELSGRD